MKAIWSGSISFGLVVIPVQMVPATKDKSIAFHQLHQEDQSRIKYLKVCGAEERAVGPEEIIKAYEYEKGKYVTLTDEEIAGADPEMTRTIDILDFVDRSHIDPVYFVKPYHLIPQAGAGKAYLLLSRAMEEAGRVAIGQAVVRTKQYLVTIRPTGDELLLETMRYPDEVIGAEELPDRPETAGITEEELRMAGRLIGEMSGEFDPEKYKDRFREKVMELVKDKVAGREVITAKPAAVAPVIDLVAALKSSLKQTQGAS